MLDVSILCGTKIGTPKKAIRTRATEIKKYLSAFRKDITKLQMPITYPVKRGGIFLMQNGP